MAPEDGGKELKNMTQGSGGGGGNDLTKGLWTPKEDAMLAKYVMENGERKWNDVSRKFGLMRCGNSCRLRWFNHLRSNIKKGDFTPEEENKILKLHAKYGNRWSRLARHLPGRSDNEIKNFWNIRLKRLVRARLPIYPPDIPQEIRCRHVNHRQLEQPQQNQTVFSSSLSFVPTEPRFQLIPLSISSFEENPNYNCIPSSHQKNTTTSSSSSIQENPNSSSINSMTLIDPLSDLLLIASLYPSINKSQFDFHSDNSGGVTLSPPPSQNENFLNSPYTHIPHLSQHAPSSTNTVQMDDAFLSKNFELEIPSIQPCFKVINPTSSPNNVNDRFTVPSNGEDNYNLDPEVRSERYNGLLEDVLRQSATLLTSQFPYEEDKRVEIDQSQGKTTHDDIVQKMNHPNSNMNLDSILGSSADDEPCG